MNRKKKWFWIEFFLNKIGLRQKRMLVLSNTIIWMKKSLNIFLYFYNIYKIMVRILPYFQIYFLVIFNITKLFREPQKLFFKKSWIILLKYIFGIFLLNRLLKFLVSVKKSKILVISWKSCQISYISICLLWALESRH